MLPCSLRAKPVLLLLLACSVEASFVLSSYARPRAPALCMNELSMLQPSTAARGAAEAESAANDAAAEETTAVWTRIRDQAVAASASSPVLAPFLESAIYTHETLPDALASVLADKIATGAALPRDLLAEQLSSLLREPRTLAALTRDLLAVVESDPAAPQLLTVMLHYKGFLALQTYRAAHALWARSAADEGDVGARQLALLLQGRASELFGVDIHPGAQIAGGVFLDHASGVVIGEQASIGTGCYLLHGVTLGATGKRDKKTGRRHPAVGAHVTIGLGASLLGPITVGDGATIGAGAMVIKDVAAGATVIDKSFMSNTVLKLRGKTAAPVA